MKHSFTFSSNSIRLSLGQWLVVVAILLGVVCLLPPLWQSLEAFRPSVDYRLPYELSDDYWLFRRWSQKANSEYPFVVLGDSVVWGHYVTKQQTLSHYLNRLKEDEAFANLGVDGIHPAALLGLVEHYGKAISNKAALLHLNPLWMGSERHDLRVEEEFRFNHPRLVPQFTPRIACYRASFGQRVGILVERNVPFVSWVSHLRMSCFDGMGLQHWTLEYPRRNPLRAIHLETPTLHEGPGETPVPWTETGMKKQNFAWVDARESLQWASFRKTAARLQANQCQLFVVLGPFNPHVLTDDSLKRYHAMEEHLETWLQEQQIPYLAPSFLPSEMYADASHPLAEGYARVASELWENRDFQQWLNQSESSKP